MMGHHHILFRTRAETLEGDGGEPQATHCALARPQGEREHSALCGDVNIVNRLDRCVLILES